MAIKDSVGIIIYQINEQGLITECESTVALPTTPNKFAVGCELLGNDGIRYENKGTVADPDWKANVTENGGGGGDVSGEPTEIPYFDGDGDLTSDENFTRDEEGNTLIKKNITATQSGIRVVFTEATLLIAEGTGTFEEGDSVEGSVSGATADIVKVYYNSDDAVWLCGVENVVGTFDETDTFIGSNSSATGSYAGYFVFTGNVDDFFVVFNSSFDLTPAVLTDTSPWDFFFITTTEVSPVGIVNTENEFIGVIDTFETISQPIVTGELSYHINADDEIVEKAENDTHSIITTTTPTSKQILINTPDTIMSRTDFDDETNWLLQDALGVEYSNTFRYRNKGFSFSGINIGQGNAGVQAEFRSGGGSSGTFNLVKAFNDFDDIDTDYSELCSDPIEAYIQKRTSFEGRDITAVFTAQNNTTIHGVTVDELGVSLTQHGYDPVTGGVILDGTRMFDEFDDPTNEFYQKRFDSRGLHISRWDGETPTQEEFYFLPPPEDTIEALDGAVMTFDKNNGKIQFDNRFRMDIDFRDTPELGNSVDFTAPENMKINSVTSPLFYSIEVNASAYTLGDEIEDGDTITVGTDDDQLVKLNCEVIELTP